MEAGLGETWDEFRDAMGAIRLQKVARSSGEFTSGVSGISVPVFNAEDNVIGSLGVAWATLNKTKKQTDDIIELLIEVGETINEKMKIEDICVALGPRAVG